STVRPVVHFSVPGVHNTTTLLLSDDGSTLYVGARDAVLSLDVSQHDVISLKNKVEWRPTPTEIKQCENKGKNPTVDCPNFVRVLLPLNSTHLYACGSYAYNPHDAHIEADSLALVPLDHEAKGRCPFNPFQRNAAVTADGELFTGTMSDFRGVQHIISRHFSKDGRPDVSQDVSVRLLEEPVFAGSSLDSSERKLYFFFSEFGKEFSFMDDLRVARVAQVCKDDVGGVRTLQRKWTSFAKASLLCQSPKQLPLTILQDVFTLPPAEGGDAADTLFYGIFSSQWLTASGSAVCVFKLQDIRTVFRGGYRKFDVETHLWSPLMDKQADLGQCGLEYAPDSVLMEVKKSFLASSIVKPLGNAPVVVSTDEKYSRVAAMKTLAANGKEYTLLFLLTETGFLHKVVLSDQGARVVEEVQVLAQPQQVKNILLSSSKDVVYVGTSEGVTAVPVADCSIYLTCSQCVLARDPLCGWSTIRSVCTSLAGSPAHMVQDVEKGNVGAECQEQIQTPVSEVYARLNEAVRLQCPKPSNLAKLTWTSPQFDTLPEKLFIQSADGNLAFLTTADTIGTYHCEAEEDGHQEVVVSYNVRQMVMPRSLMPGNYNTNSTDEEEIAVTSPETVGSEEPTSNQPRTPGDESITIPEDETVPNKMVGFKPTSRIDRSDTSDVTSIAREEVCARRKKLDEVQPQQKSYHSELVVVSLLLLTCVCILTFGGFVMWHQKKAGLKTRQLVIPEDGGGDAKRSLERVPALSRDGPEQKAAE
ncbi:hypothetical protein LDENG_00217200, partial [Lucifuga dentata]